jgi:Crp-like helix-turn-helix protein
MSHLLSRNVRIQEDLVDQPFNSAEKRLARILLLLAHFGIEGTPEPVIAKVSQETLAEMIGTTRSRVSFFMNKFRKLGFRQYNGGLHIHNSLHNIVLTTSVPLPIDLCAGAGLCHLLQATALRERHELVQTICAVYKYPWFTRNHKPGGS